MALTVRVAADVLARQYVTRTQLSVSVKPGVKEQLADRAAQKVHTAETVCSTALAQKILSVTRRQESVDVTWAG